MANDVVDAIGDVRIVPVVTIDDAERAPDLVSALVGRWAPGRGDHPANPGRDRRHPSSGGRGSGCDRRRRVGDHRCRRRDGDRRRSAVRRVAGTRRGGDHDRPGPRGAGDPRDRHRDGIDAGAGAGGGRRQAVPRRGGRRRRDDQRLVGGVARRAIHADRRHLTGQRPPVSRPAVRCWPSEGRGWCHRSAVAAADWASVTAAAAAAVELTQVPT